MWSTLPKKTLLGPTRLNGSHDRRPGCGSSHVAMKNMRWMALDSGNEEHCHGHSHGHSHGHCHEHDHGHCHEHDHGHCHEHCHEHKHEHCHEHNHEHSHGHSHGHSHAAYGCCAQDAEETFLSKALSKFFSSIGISDLVQLLRHSAAAMGLSVAALLLSGCFRLLCRRSCDLEIGRLISVTSLSMVFLLLGLPMLTDFLLGLAKLSLDTHVLMALAVVGSLFLGLPNEGALLLLLYQLSHMLEARFTREANVSLESLFDSVPDKATAVQMNPDGSPDLANSVSVCIDEVQVGSHILVLPGEQVPLDGVVVHGRASITMDHISGESLPVHVKEGSSVAAGSRNNDGVLVLATTQTMQNSTPAKIAQLALDAQLSKPVVKKWVDSITSKWSAGVLIAASGVLTACLLRNIPLTGERGAIYRAMGVVTAAAPCGLVLAPLAYICALANATKRRILIKSAGVLDLLYASRYVGVDKTGTLTKGSLTCTGILSSATATASQNGSMKSSQVSRALEYAVALSHRSSHPVARAVNQVGKQLHVHVQTQVENFEMIPGAGVRGQVPGPDGAIRDLHFGSLDYVLEFLPVPEHARLEKAVSGLGMGKSVSVLLEVAGDAVEWTVFCFEDQIRSNSAGAVRALQTGAWKSGVPCSTLQKEVIMLTGDASSSAQSTASALGIAKVHSELKPEQKLDLILQGCKGTSDHNGFVMVGDGLNDAPALSAADVGVAIANTASGASASIADIVILNGQGVGNLPFLMQLAHSTRCVVQQNLLLVFASMVVATVPTVAGIFPLWLAVLLHEGTTLFTAMNSLRLLIAQPDSFGPKPAVPMLQSIGQLETSQHHENVTVAVE